MTLGPKAKSREVPAAAEPAVGDKLKKGPSNLILTDNTIVHTSPLVQSKIPNKNTSDLYIAEPVLNSKKTKPFMYMVGLRGKGGIVMNIKGLFDDGAMINSICKTAYATIKDKLGNLHPSSQTLHMANGVCVPSLRKWVGNIRLNSQSIKSTFKVFPSGGGWSLLFGKPLLKKFKAIHNYKDDTIYLPKRGGGWDVLTNAHSETPDPQANGHTQTLNEVSETPTSNTTPCIKIEEPVGQSKSRRGQRLREKVRRAEKEPKDPAFWKVVWTVTETPPSAKGKAQPKINAKGNEPLFTRQTDPRNPEQVTEILKQVKISPDILEAQRKKVVVLLTEFTNCFALSVRKVLPIPGAEHHINIPPDVISPKKVPHQKLLSDSQCTYLNKAVDELLAADIVETICPEDIKCCLPITLAQKPHDTPGLSLNKLQHRVNEECISHDMTPVLENQWYCF